MNDRSRYQRSIGTAASGAGATRLDVARESGKFGVVHHNGHAREIFYGIRLLPIGSRRQGLWDATRIIFSEDFSGWVLSFDNDAADAYAEVATSRRSAGKPISQFDAMIAAVVRSRGAMLATRNVKDFVDCGIHIVDPWNE